MKDIEMSRFGRFPELALIGEAEEILWITFGQTDGQAGCGRLDICCDKGRDANVDEAHGKLRRYAIDFFAKA